MYCKKWGGRGNTQAQACTHQHGMFLYSLNTLAHKHQMCVFMCTVERLWCKLCQKEDEEKKQQQQQKRTKCMKKECCMYAFVKCIQFDSYWTSNGSNSVQQFLFVSYSFCPPPSPHSSFPFFLHLQFSLTISRHQSGWDTVKWNSATSVSWTKKHTHTQNNEPLDAKKMKWGEKNQHTAHQLAHALELMDAWIAINLSCQPA